MIEIQNDKIRQIINAGIAAKIIHPSSDLTPNSYKRLENYITKCETEIIESGRKLPTII